MLFKLSSLEWDRERDCESLRWAFQWVSKRTGLGAG